MHIRKMIGKKVIFRVGRSHFGKTIFVEYEGFLLRLKGENIEVLATQVKSRGIIHPNPKRPLTFPVDELRYLRPKN